MVELVIGLLVISVSVIGIAVITVAVAFKTIVKAKDAKIHKLIKERNRYWNEVMSIHSVEPIELVTDRVKFSMMEVDGRSFIKYKEALRRDLARAIAEELEKYLFYEVFHDRSDWMPVNTIMTRLKFLPPSKDEIYGKMNQGKWHDYPLDFETTRIFNKELLKEVDNG